MERENAKNDVMYVHTLRIRICTKRYVNKKTKITAPEKEPPDNNIYDYRLKK